MIETKSIQGQSFERQLKVNKRAIDEEARTVELAFSSEEPYERWFGIEILDHSPGAIRLGRMENGGAVLMDHNTRDQVGVVESVRVDEDRVGRAVVRFGKSARASEIFQDVVDGIRRHVSVGYLIHKAEETRPAKDGKVAEYRMTDWEPHEMSFVSVPADPTVGVGRSAEPAKPKAPKEETPMSEKTTGKADPEKPAIDLEAERRKASEGAITQERKRISDIQRLADEHNLPDLGNRFIEDGGSVEDFQSEALVEIGKRNQASRAAQDPDKKPEIGLSKKDESRYSIARLMLALSEPRNRALQDAAAFEFEVGHEAARHLGIEQPRGAVIPHEVIGRVLTAGTATDGAELVETSLLAGSFIDVLRAKMVTMQAGAFMIPGLVGNVDIPRKTSGATVGWVSAEDGDAGESDPQFDQVALTPHDLAVYTDASRRLLMQSTPAIDGLIRKDFFDGAAVALDNAGLNGSDSSGQPAGVASQTGINTFDLAAADPTYAETVRMVTETMLDNADIGSLAYIIDPNGWEAAMTTEKATNTAVFIYNEAAKTINGHRTLVSTQVAAEDWFFGNWSDLFYGLWGGVEVTVDPYTNSIKGRTRFVLFQTADVAVRHPTSFCYANDAVA